VSRRRRARGKNRENISGRILQGCARKIRKGSRVAGDRKESIKASGRGKQSVALFSKL
jgi:hypothetical protein